MLTCGIVLKLMNNGLCKHYLWMRCLDYLMLMKIDCFIFFIVCNIIRFSFKTISGLDISLRSPTGKEYDTSSPECEQDTTFQVYRFTFLDISDVRKFILVIYKLLQDLMLIAMSLLMIIIKIEARHSSEMDKYFLIDKLFCWQSRKAMLKMLLL